MSNFNDLLPDIIRYLAAKTILLNYLHKSNAAMGTSENWKNNYQNKLMWAKNLIKVVQTRNIHVVSLKMFKVKLIFQSKCTEQAPNRAENSVFNIFNTVITLFLIFTAFIKLSKYFHSPSCESYVDMTCQLKLVKIVSILTQRIYLHTAREASETWCVEW